MARVSVNKSVETNVLVKCRRRCCICFGLNRDTALKSGQIAHLDQNSANNAEENLAFLCFHHHDEYDSRTSQRKGLTEGEVKRFRVELIESISHVFAQKVHFGELITPPADPYAGQWIRLGIESNSAEILITPLPDNLEGFARYFVNGLALWGEHRESGPNMGFLDFVAIIDEPNFISYVRPLGSEKTVTHLRFLEPGIMQIEEHNWVGAYGMNVTFEGVYKKAGSAK